MALLLNDLPWAEQVELDSAVTLRVGEQPQAEYLRE